MDLPIMIPFPHPYRGWIKGTHPPVETSKDDQGLELVKGCLRRKSIN